MGDNRRLGTYAGFFLVVVFLSFLAVAPGLLRKTDYRLPTPNSANSLQKFPLDHKFKELAIDRQRKVKAIRDVSIPDLIGAPRESIVINFWASWCAPCLEEMPSYEFMARQLAASSGPNPRVIAISVDERIEEIQSVLATFDFVPSFTILHDPSGAFSSSIGTTKFPETYWVKRDGQILHKWAGPQDWLSRDVLSRIADLSRR